MILQDETLFNLTEEDENKLTPSSPPTKVVTVKQHFTVGDQNEMLSLAQKQFDQLRKKNKERASSVRYGRSSSRMRSSDSHEEMKISQLLSSLLYLSLMMHKVDDMKKVLEASDGSLYNEWLPLFDPMHSPMFHLCERKMHNDRVKKIFSRKRKYRELYEEAKASLAIMETTSNNLSEAMSKMADENLRCQGLLELKSKVELDLCASEEKSKKIKEQLQNTEKEAATIKSTCNGLESKLKELEIEKIKLIQEIETCDACTGKNTIEIADLKIEKEEKASKLQKAEQIIVALEKDKCSLQEQLEAKVESHGLILEEKEKHVQFLKDSEANLQISIEKVTAEMKECEDKLATENEQLRLSLANAGKELEKMTIKFEISQEALDDARGDLTSKHSMLEKAMETNRFEQSNQTKLREMIVLKDKEINQSSERLRSVEIKLLKTEHDAQATSQLHDADQSKAQQQISHLEKQMIESTAKFQQLTRDVAGARASEETLKEEKISLQSHVKMLKRDLEDSNEKYKKMENKLSQDIISLKECKGKMKEQFNDLSTESSSCIEENRRLTQELGTMEDTLEKSTQNACETKDSVEARAKEAERRLLEIKVKLAKVEAENDILKTSNKACIKELTHAQANALSKEREASLLQISIDELKKENNSFSKKLDSVRDNSVEDMKNMLEKQIKAEVKVTELQNQLKMVNRPSSAVSQQNSSSLSHSLIVSGTPDIAKSSRVGKLGSENSARSPLSKAEISTSIIHGEKEYAKIVVTNVMTTAVNNASPKS